MSKDRKLLLFAFFTVIFGVLTMVWKPSKTVFYLSAAGTVAGLAICIKGYMAGGIFSHNASAAGKVVVITGANTGIGKETARELAKRGAKVYMACRNLSLCEKARQEIVLESNNKYVYCRHCDLASLQSVRDFAKSFTAEQNRIDILINNAGVMRCPLMRTKEGFEMQLGVNHMGHFLLTNLLLDTIKNTPKSRIVNVSSLAHTRGKINVEDLNSDRKYDPGEAYNQSKLANILFTRELAKRLKGTDTTVNALHPGVVETELMRHMSIFNSYLAAVFVKPFMWLFMKTPVQGAQTSLYAALYPDLDGVTGKYFSDCAEKEVAPQARDDNVGKWLWEVSERWTGLSSKKAQ